jgi:hypothetical protein
MNTPPPIAEINKKSTKKYDKISELSESTTPITKRRLKNTSLKKGRGVIHPSVNTAPSDGRNLKNAPSRSDSR